MTWRGTLRTINAEIRRQERAAQRRHRELERQRKQMEKEAEIARAAYEVEVYENEVAMLVSVHHEHSQSIEWEAMEIAPEPRKPELSQTTSIMPSASLRSSSHP